jgi:DNA mismatch repair protein MutS
VLARAREVLTLLEGEKLAAELGGRGADGSRFSARGARGGSSAPASDQLGLFAAAPHPLVEQLQRVDPNQMTPMEALQMIAKLKGLTETEH